MTMIQFEYLLIVVALVFLCGLVDSVQYSIEPNDRIMFIGDSNTFQGSTAPHGFVNIFQRELKKQFEEATVFNAAINLATNEQIREKIIEGGALKFYMPTKIIMVSGHDQFVNYTSTSLKTLRFEIESIMAAVVDIPISFIFCSTLLYGEKIDGSNEMDEIVEEFVGMTQRVAKVYDVMFIDLYSKQLKYLETTNIDNLPSSILTHNGTALNAAGHSLVASTLLQELGINQDNANAETILAVKQRDAMSRRAERVRVREFDLGQSGIRSTIVSAV
jgi:hypothetical protein